MLRLSACVGTICMSLGLGGCAGRTDAPPVAVLKQDVREIPCDARRVLQVVCQQCHASPPRNQAPFALVTYADTQALLDGMPIWTYMRTVVESGMMPLAPVKIDPADRETLAGWLDAGAPPLLASSLCEQAVDSGGGNDTDTDAGPGSLESDGGSGAGDAATVPPSSDAIAPDAPSNDAVDAGGEMAAAMTPDADAAAASDAPETCCSNDGSAPAD